MHVRTILRSLGDPGLARRPLDRREALRRGLGAGAGALVGAAAVPAALAALARGTAAQQVPELPQPAIDALNLALTLEYLGDELYRLGLAQPALVPAEDRPVFEQIAKHEAAHVALLQQTLGSAAAARPTFDLTAAGAFADVLTNYTTFQLLAQGMEDLAVRAYKGQAPALMASRDVLGVALRIHSVEARHASEVRRLRGARGWIAGDDAVPPALAPIYAGEETANPGADGDAASRAFDEPLDAAAVRQIVEPFIVS